jgi:hypothetical protein
VSLRARVHETESGASQERTGERGGGQRRLPSFLLSVLLTDPFFTRQSSHLAPARFELRQRVWLQYIY